MELQVYGPGYVPQFEGFGCAANRYCAAMTIDSLRTGPEQRDRRRASEQPACNNYVFGGIEPVNWAT